MFNHSKAYWQAFFAGWVIWAFLCFMTDWNLWVAMGFAILLGIQTHMGKIMEHERIRRQLFVHGYDSLNEPKLR